MMDRYECDLDNLKHVWIKTDDSGELPYNIPCICGKGKIVKDDTFIGYHFEEVDENDDSRDGPRVN
jgi:hypothetical protein